MIRIVYLFQRRNHDVRSVVDRKHNIRNSGSSQALDLMQDHRPVRKLDQWFRKSEGLYIVELSLGIQERTDCINWGRMVLAVGAPWVARWERTRGRRRVPKPPTRIRAAQILYKQLRLSRE